jgi:hypothetical protein
MRGAPGMMRRRRPDDGNGRDDRGDIRNDDGRDGSRPRTFRRRPGDDSTSQH